MLKIIAVFFLAIGVTLSACRAEAAAPRLTLPSKSIDLGVSSPGDKPSGFFMLRNTGSAPLNIIEIKPSCGCTVARLDKKVIKPGGSVKVMVAIDTGGKTGRYAKTIKIKTDDPLTPEAVVEITGTVIIEEHGKGVDASVIFSAGCAACHAKPAEGKLGEPLFEAVCSMCHGHYGLGGSAPRINALQFVENNTDKYIRQVIEQGVKDTSMPGFTASKGGPLNEEQVNSLINIIRWWEHGYVFKENEKKHE